MSSHRSYSKLGLCIGKDSRATSTVTQHGEWPLTSYQQPFNQGALCGTTKEGRWAIPLLFHFVTH